LAFRRTKKRFTILVKKTVKAAVVITVVMMMVLKLILTVMTLPEG
jgi:hypothetical protein